MSEDLDAIERDIRTTRARLAANLSVLTSPITIDELKATVKAEALEASDDLMDRAKVSGMSMLRKGLDDLKDKAMENPAAVAAIGAGIGWKLWKNPPVASALVGYGLFSLFRGSANDPVQNAVREARGRIEETTSAVFQTATETAHDIRDKTVAIADDVQRKASAMLGDVQDRASAATMEVRETASALAGEASSTVSRLAGEAEAMGRDAKEIGQDAWARSQQSGRLLYDDMAERTRHLRTDPQSQILLSIAGVAVAAAVGVAVSRYRSGPDA
jgi:hypothetical protein